MSATRAISFDTLTLQLSGFQSVDVESFEASHKATLSVRKDKEGRPISYTVKDYDNDLKIGIEAGKDFQLLVSLAAPYNGNLVRLPPFPMIASFDPGDGPVLRYMAPKVKITQFKMGAKKGDDEMKIPLDMVLLSEPIITFA